MKEGNRKGSGRGNLKVRTALLSVMAAVTFLCLSGCGSTSMKNSKYVGKWVAASYEMSGFKMDGDEDSGIVLNDNGKGTFKLMGQEADITWKENDGGIHIKDAKDSYDLKADGDVLLMDDSELKITFVREGSSAVTTAAETTAKVTTAAAKKETTAAPETTKAQAAVKDGESSLMGYWRLSAMTGDNGEKVSDFNEVMGTDETDPDIQEMGDIMQLQFNDRNSVYYGTMGLGIEGTWTADGDSRADMKVSDSQYKVELKGNELMLSEEDSGKVMTYYFQKADGEFDTANLVKLSDLNQGEDTTESGGAGDYTWDETSEKTGADSTGTAAFDGTVQSTIVGTWIAYKPGDSSMKNILTLLVYDNAGAGDTFSGYLMTGDAKITYFCDVKVVSQDSVRITPTSDTTKKEADYKVKLDDDGKGMTWTFSSGDKTVDTEVFHLEKVE